MPKKNFYFLISVLFSLGLVEAKSIEPFNFRAFHDLAVCNAYGKFICLGDSLYLTCGVTNNGDTVETNFYVSVSIFDSLGTIIFAESSIIANIVPGDTVQISFPSHWIPTSIGEYSIKYKHLVVDQNPSNDSKVVDAEVVILPAELDYDDGVGEAVYGVSNSLIVYGMTFEPPIWPIKIDSIKFNFYYDYSDSCPISYIVAIGPYPWVGSIVYQSETVFVKSGWHTHSLVNQNIIVDAGDLFHIGYFKWITSSLYLWCDTTPPYAYRDFSFLMSKGLLQDLNSDLMIRSFISWAGGINEYSKIKIAQANSKIAVVPNPFETSTQITIQPLDEDALLAIYDITGRIVRNFKISECSVFRSFRWDGDDNTGNALPLGVYLIRLTIGDKHEIKKVVKLK